MTTPLRLDSYVRVSKVGGRSGEGFISPKVQAEANQQWGEARGHTVTHHDPELDVSGGTMNRPVLGHLLERIANGQSDGLIVYKVDRFARSLLGALTTLEAIAKGGGTFASVSDQVDMTTAQGRAFLQMQLVFAELFRAQITESFNVATERAVSNGIHISNQVPFGYDRTDERRLVPNEQAVIVREVFERRAQGQGASAIGRWLDTVAPRPNGAQWVAARVRDMLQMRVYVGEAYHGQHSNPDAHEPIITGAQFHAAHAARGISIGRGEEPILLTGLVRCAGCRYLMTPSKSGAKGETLTYRCRKKHTAGDCPAPATISRGRLEEYVREQAKLYMLATRGVAGSKGTPNLEAAAAHREAVRADNAAFAVDTGMRAMLGDEGYEAAKRERTEIQRQADADYYAAMGPPAGDIPVEDLTDDDVVRWRSELARIFDVIFVRKFPGKPAVEDRVWILGLGEGPDDLPRRGRVNGPVRPFEWPEGVSGVLPG